MSLKEIVCNVFPSLDRGLTPFHLLCYEQDFGTLEKLTAICERCNIIICPQKDDFGLDPFQIAADNKYILQILTKYYSNRKLRLYLAFNQDYQTNIQQPIPNLITKKIKGLGKYLDSF